MKKKVLFVNDEMTMGGVARILNTFLKYIDKDKYDIDLLVLHKRGELLSEIPIGINVLEGTSFFNTIDMPLSLCKGSKLFSKIRLLFYMKTGLIKKKIASERKKMLNKQYDIEFSAKEGFCTIFTAYGDSKRKLNWVQVDYKKSNYSSHHMDLVKDALSHIDMNIACSDTVSNSYKEVFKVKNIEVVHNLVDEERIKELSNEEKDIELDNKKINLICVARFHKQKGVDRLINSYAKLKEYYNLVIIGDGELKEELYNLAKEKNCFDDIKWLGIRSNPYVDIKTSDLLVMPSLYEGYPTLSVETLISGTPVLATKVAGIDEQLTKVEHGWIVDNSEEALYMKLDELKDKKELLKAYKEKLKEYKYDNDSILSKYYELFEVIN